MKNHKMMLCVILLTLFPFTLMAQSDSVWEKMRPLLEEDTFCVVHIDFTKLDTTAILNNNREFLEKIAADLGIGRDELHRLIVLGVDGGAPDMESVNFDAQWQRMIDMIDGGKTLLTDMLGVKEAFLVMGVGKNFPTFNYVAIPVTPDLNVEMIKQMLATNDSILCREDDAYLVMGFHWIPRHVLEDMKQSFIASLGPKRPFERPDFLAAYETVKDDPVQILFAMPQFVKKIVTELRPGLPEQSGLIQHAPALREVDIPALIKGFRFKAVGLDLEAGRLNAVVEAETELDMQVIAKQTRIITDAAIDLFVKHLEQLAAQQANDEPLSPADVMMLALYPEVIHRDSLTQFRDAAIPQPVGNRSTVRWDRDTAGGYLSTSGIVLTKLIQINVSVAQEAARRMQCANHMKMLGLALHNYHDVHKSLPPTYVVDKDGKPLHSWRVLLLPYLGQHVMYKEIRLDEPWDNEHNRQFHDRMPFVFRCPSCVLGDPKRDATYCQVVGDESLGRGNGTLLSFRNVSDGTSNTIAFVERKTPICWMAPEDVSFDDAVLGINKVASGLGSEHSRGINVSLLDGSVHFISDTINLDVLRALLTIAGGESVRLP